QEFRSLHRATGMRKSKRAHTNRSTLPAKDNRLPGSDRGRDSLRFALECFPRRNRKAIQPARGAMARAAIQTLSPGARHSFAFAVRRQIGLPLRVLKTFLGSEHLRRAGRHECAK